MFTVASDLSEAQRERLTSSLSLQGVTVTAYTFEAVRTVFVESFCTPKSSMENSSLRVKRYGGMSRTFIVEDFIEDEFGPWATDELTGEQGYIDDEGSCFWTWDDNEYAWQCRPFRSRQFKKKEDKRKGKEGAYPQSSGFSASESPSEEGQGHSWESDDRNSNFTDDSSRSACTGTTAWYDTRHTAWMASVPLHLAHHPTHVVLDPGCIRSLGSRTAIRRFQKHALYYGITTEFCPCNKSFVFANSETETCW